MVSPMLVRQRMTPRAGTTRQLAQIRYRVLGILRLSVPELGRESERTRV